MLSLLLAFTLSAYGATPGEVRSYSTLRSIGIEWDISGDPDLDTAVSVRFQREEESEWHEAMPLVRTHYAKLTQSKMSGLSAQITTLESRIAALPGSGSL